MAENRGRPTAYDQWAADEICFRLADGESLVSICQDKEMPCRATVYNWLDDPKHSDFLDRYKRARERQAETLIDECLDIADETSGDTITKKGANGEEYENPNHEWINRSRLRVETRMKLAEKLYPKKYKPSQHVEHTGKGGAALTPVLNVSFTGNKS